MATADFLPQPSPSSVEPEDPDLDPKPRPDELPGGLIFAELYAEAERDGGRHWEHATTDERDKIATLAAVGRRRAEAQARRAGFPNVSAFLAATVDPPELAALAGKRGPEPLRAVSQDDDEFLDAMRDPADLAAVRLQDLDANPPPPLWHGRIDPTDHTILYGTGDVGKGTLAASWIARFAEDVDVFDGIAGSVLILDYENHPNEWARRIRGLAKGPIEDLDVRWTAPLRYDWLGRRGPIWDQAADLRAIVEYHDITLVVVDSIVPACGGADVTETGAPSRYAAAIQQMGVPVLSLAHVTKADDLRYPFGSVFWHNLCRVSWSLSRTAGGRLELVNRKSNNYAKAGRAEVIVTWLDDELREVWERPYSAALAERIDEALTDGPLTAGQLVDRLNEECEDGEEPVKANSVRAALRRGLTGLAARYTVTGGGTAATYGRRAT